MAKLIRMGYCCKCGKCCGKCEHLSEPIFSAEGIKEQICLIHDAEKLPCGGETFPQHPCYIYDMKDVCTYYFVDAETGKRVDWKPPEAPFRDDEIYKVIFTEYDIINEPTEDK